MTPKSFLAKVRETLLLLKTKGGWFDLFDLWLKITPYACFLESGLKLILYWKAQPLRFFKSLLNSFEEVFIIFFTTNTAIVISIFTFKVYVLNFSYTPVVRVNLPGNFVRGYNGNNATNPFVLYLPSQLVYDLFEIKLSFNWTIILEKLNKFLSVRYYFMWWWKILTFTYLLTDWLTDRPTDQPIDQPTDQPTDWLT